MGPGADRKVGSCTVQSEVLFLQNTLLLAAAKKEAVELPSLLPESQLLFLRKKHIYSLNVSFSLKSAL